MTDTLVPTRSIEIVEEFWDAMRRSDLAALNLLLDDDVRWENVGLPTVRGHATVMRALSSLNLPGAGFDVKIHRITANGNTVMTERTDVVIVGPLHIAFWVCGVTEVSADGKLTLWRDYADVWNITKGLTRGVLGILVPALRPKL
ncbi:limonene-1,2-epoxide hydrolase family protein [Mycobacteroides saopaulense]|uniref:Limonene-1,2-epoxide hydrolase n=1 Tax=Mycobacteroides saopaulense TaxID=1578165 RepID=A0ABX3BVF3_9MYCO|nr:limonene-1,2-epoxide hydrolase family protein [Mycobacteroides saopaulense]OHT88060.1 limonene-1,2-epoxide hydrolase [Mycobacteroides saopaulense]OHU06401.1 limonene-1,2-epoxide hydrolase [Mycobacteroides saopaulense]